MKRSGGQDYRAELQTAIMTNDVARVRGMLEKRLWSDKTQEIRWGLYDVDARHLQMALIQENGAMVKLLASYGARFDGKSFERTVLDVMPEKRPLYESLLRRAGIAWDESADHAQDIQKLPWEWRRTLGRVPSGGRAGGRHRGRGPLRDLFNGRTVKDVDIFLASRGGKADNEAFIWKAFTLAGLEIGNAMTVTAMTA